MNSLQIDKIGRKILGSKWLGVFSLDKLPILRLGGLIVNTHTSNLPGEHWIALHVGKNKINVMDPFGLYYPDKLVKEISKYKKKIHFNRKCYQDPTTKFCGHICLIWLASL